MLYGNKIIQNKDAMYFYSKYGPCFVQIIKYSINYFNLQYHKAIIQRRNTHITVVSTTHTNISDRSVV